MDTISRRSEPAAGPADAAGARRPRLVTGRACRALRRLQGHHQQDRARRGQPTAVVLVRLASAFDLTLAGLMLRAEGQGERLSRAAEQPVWRDPETGYVRKQVFSRPDHPVEIIRVEMPARQRVTLPASSYTHIRQLRLGAGGHSRHHRRRRAARARRRRLSRTSVRRRTRPSPTRPTRPAPMSWRLPGAEPCRPESTIAALTDPPHIRSALSELLVETVANGGSVSFMHPLPLEAADAFWRELAGRGRRAASGSCSAPSTAIMLVGDRDAAAGPAAEPAAPRRDRQDDDADQSPRSRHRDAR